MSFCMDDEMVLEKYKTIRIKTEDLQNIEVNALSNYDEMYIKAKIRTFGDNFWNSSRELNALEGDIECEVFTIFFTDSLFVSEK